jgi:hypothetical protein
MIDTVKKKIAELLVNRSIKEMKSDYSSLADFYKKTFNILVLMPEDEAEFHQSFSVLKFLEETKKNAYIFTHDFRVSLIPTKYRPHVVEHTVGETNRLNLATHKLINKLKEKNFQAVIDLNIKDNIFFSHIISSIDVPLRIGFKKNHSDKYYNIQINSEDSKPEISYKNLVNCLHMF